MKRSWSPCRVALLCVVIGCAEEESAVPTMTSPMANAANQIMSGVNFSLVTAGVRQATLLADTAFFFQRSDSIELRAVKTEFFSRIGAKTGTLTAREGTYRSKRQQMEARGDVVITSEDGRRLTTPQIAYDQHTNRITSDSAWVMTQSNGDVARGVGFETDPNLTFFDCSNCGGVFRVPPPQP